MSTYSRSQEIGTFISMRLRLAASGQLRNPLYAAADPPASGRCPTARGPSELPARYSRSSELFQVPEIVLVKESNVRRPRAQHREPLDPPAKRESLITSRVVADAAKDVGMDHAAACGFDPAVAAADAAVWIATLAGEAVECDLRGRLGEREVVDAKTDLAVAPEDLPRERVQRPFEVGHRELLVDGQTLVLEEDRLADGIGRLEAVAPPRNDDANRRLPFLHHSHLHRRGVRAAEDRTRRIVAKRVRHPERVPFLARGMADRDVQCFEVVVVPLDLVTFDRLEAERPEDPRDLADRLRDWMQTANAKAPRREGHVLGPFECRIEGGALKLTLLRGEKVLDPLFRHVGGRPDGPLLIGGQSAQLRQDLGEQSPLAAKETGTLLS